MSEAQSEAPGILLPELSVESSTDNDKALMAIWEKNHSPEAELKNPAMPETMAAAEGDHFKAAWDWSHLPMKERRETAAVHREFAVLKKQGEALGMKTESAADLKAIQDMLAGKGEAQSERPAPIDKDVQATYETVRAVFPNAKDSREATNSLRGLVDHVARDPVEGTLAVLNSLPLTPYQRHQVYERMFGEAVQSAPRQAQPAAAEDSGVSAWAAKRGVSVEDQRAMGDIVSEPTWREIAGENINSTLDRAYKALQRRGRLNATGRQNRDMDTALRAVAADIYRA